MKFNRKYIKYAILALILIIIVPLGIDFLIIGNKFPSNLSNSDWVVFLGSYIGSIIGSLATLVGILITIKFTRDQTIKDREIVLKQTVDARNFILKQSIEDRRLSIAPYLKFTMLKNTLPDSKHDMTILYVPDDNENTYANATITIKNVGIGPLLNFKVFNITYNSEIINMTIDGRNDVLEKNSEWLMMIDIRLRLDEIKNDRLIKVSRCSSEKYRPSPECPQSTVLIFTIGYEDLIGNKYEQDIKITIDIACESKDGGITWKYLEPSLYLTSIGKSKIINKDTLV